MAEDWTAIADEVRAALEEVGFAVTLTRKGARDPLSPENDPTWLPDTTHTLTVMQDTISLGLIDGTLVRTGDTKLMVAAESTAPTTADKITLNGKAREVVIVEPFAPGGQPVYFEVLLRA